MTWHVSNWGIGELLTRGCVSDQLPLCRQLRLRTDSNRKTTGKVRVDRDPGTIAEDQIPGSLTIRQRAAPSFNDYASSLGKSRHQANEVLAVVGTEARQHFSADFNLLCAYFRHEPMSCGRKFDVHDAAIPWPPLSDHQAAL